MSFKSIHSALKGFSVIAFIFFANPAAAQKSPIDSLRQAVSMGKADTTRVKNYYKLGLKLYTISEYDSALFYAGKSEALAESLTDLKGAARAINLIGVVNMERGNYKGALKKYEEAMGIWKKLGNRKGLAMAYGNIGLIYWNMGNYPESLKNHLMSLKIDQEEGDKTGLAATYNNIGILYRNQGNLTEALRNYHEAMKIRKETGDKAGLATSYLNMGIIYDTQGNLEEALKYDSAALVIQKELGDRSGLSNTYNNLGNLYQNRKNYNLALKYQLRSLEISTELKNKFGIETAWVNLSETCRHLRRFPEAEDYANKALTLATEIGELDGVKDANAALSEIYQETGRPAMALDAYKDFIMARDSLLNEANTKKTLETQMQYDFDRKEEAAKLEQIKKDIIAAHEKRNDRIIILSVSIGLLLVIILSGLILKNLRINQKQNRIITEQKHLVEKQKNIVEEKHKEISDSIHYAERIQRCLLAGNDMLSSNFREYFVLYRPKDVVSGDFYWAAPLSNGKFVFLTADSTGHGVPGAIMSILNISCIEKAIDAEKLTEPADILNYTSDKIIQILKKDGSAEGGKDGMDCSLIAFDFKKQEITYSSANNPVLIVRGAELLEFKPDKMSVGRNEKGGILFTQHTHEIRKDDMIYTLTDGMADQFGGPKGKKFMYRQLRELLVKIAAWPVEKQKTALAEALDHWKSGLEQIDDITLIGIRV
jgi:tetratricopeptide (TPR) repeat protein